MEFEDIKCYRCGIYKLGYQFHINKKGKRTNLCIKCTHSVEKSKMYYQCYIHPGVSVYHCKCKRQRKYKKII